MEDIGFLLCPQNYLELFDNFSTTSSHALPTLIRKGHDAKVRNENQVTLWGTGKPQREIMEVDDFARALTLVVDKYDDEEAINIGVGKDKIINEIAQNIKELLDLIVRLFETHQGLMELSESYSKSPN